MTALFNMESMYRIKDEIDQYIQVGNLNTNTVGAYRMRENYGYEFSLNGQRGLFKIIYDSRNNTFSLTQIEILEEGVRNTTNPILNENLKKCMEFIYAFKNNC